MKTRLPAAARHRLLIPLAATCVIAPVALHAQNAVQPLPQVVVSATRTPQDLKFTPESVTALSLAALDSMQVPDLRTALAQTPGVIVVNTGAVGSQSSIFLRGANEDETLFVVDGIRLNTAQATYSNFLGGADLVGLDRVEVLRGPQSTLYGSSAMGGVILLETAHGSGRPSGIVSAFAGSFDSLGAEMAESGGSQASDYSISISHEETRNDRPYNRYKNWNYSGRLEGRPTPWLLVGTTVRGQVGHYEEPGPVTYASAGDVQTVTDLVTAYTEARAADRFRSRLTAGWYQDEYTFNDGNPYDFYYARNTRDILDWQNTWEAAPWAEIVAGLNAEWSHYQSGGLTADRSEAAYLSSTLHPVAAFEMDVGLRHDHFDTVGGATTWRAGVAYRWWKWTKVRATFGTGFNAPTPGDRYGMPPYILPNPSVQPERSRGWDIGIDQDVAHGRATLSVTWFENRFRDLLEYEVTDPVTYAGKEVNVDRATTSGLEFAATAKLSTRITLRTGYTYLEATDDVTHTRLIRRPRHTWDADAEVQVTKKWLIGTGVYLVTDRVDGLYAPAPLAGYTTLRLYSSYALRPDLILKLRAENLLDRKYEEVAGYPALPRAFYGSLEWRF